MKTYMSKIGKFFKLRLIPIDVHNARIGIGGYVYSINVYDSGICLRFEGVSIKRVLDQYEEC